jgi:arylsulfatase A-like enzyme
LPLLERHNGDDKLFVWIHYTDPHAPYYLPPGETNPFLDDAHYTGSEEVPRHVARGYRLGDERELRYYEAQYDANVRVADRAIGELLDRAKSLGLLDDALVVFTADHGESLGEHDSWFEHGPQPYNTTARVPLLFFGKGVAAGRRVSRPVELVDLYPTLRDLVAPRKEVHGLEGESLAPWLRAKPPGEGKASEFKYAYSEAGERPRYYRSVQDGGWKLVQGFLRRGGGGATPTGFELYDLARDPGETVNLAAHDTEALRRMRAALLRWAKTGAEARPEGGADAEAERAIRALGYANN